MTQEVQQQNKPFVEYAAYIVDEAATKQYDAITAFTGIAVALSAMMVDFSSDGEGNVDEDILEEVVERFGVGLAAALKFSREQLKTQLAAN
jgi:hypothetical protein